MQLFELYVSLPVVLEKCQITVFGRIRLTFFVNALTTGSADGSSANGGLATLCRFPTRAWIIRRRLPLLIPQCRFPTRDSVGKHSTSQSLR